MTTLEDYRELVNQHEDQNQFQGQETLRATLDFYQKWKKNIMDDIYDSDTIFSIEWDFLYEEEKRLYSHNSES